jgi:hypothetical protein
MDHAGRGTGMLRTIDREQLIETDVPDVSKALAASEKKIDRR